MSTPSPVIYVPGKKLYLYVIEVENEYGDWYQDEYSIEKGFWVVHDGNMHYVYSETKKARV